MGATKFLEFPGVVKGALMKFFTKTGFDKERVYEQVAQWRLPTHDTSSASHQTKNSDLAREQEKLETWMAAGHTAEELARVVSATDKDQNMSGNVQNKLSGAKI